MLKLILFFLLMIPQINIFSQGKIFFDVKTKMLEKAKLTHIKSAAVWQLSQTEWAGVTEVTGDYQLWLKNYNKLKEDNVITINLDIELRTVKTFGEGELLGSRSLNVIYVLDIESDRADSQYEYYKKMFSQFSQEIRTEAYEVSRRIIEELYYMVLP